MTSNIKKALFIILLVSTQICLATPNLKFKIIGLDKEILENVTTKLQLKLLTVESNPSAINTFYQEIPSELSETLKIYGCFKATVSQVSLTQSKNKYEGIFKVRKGDPLKIVNIDLLILGSGASNEKIIGHLRSFPLKSGMIFRVDQYNAAKQFLFDLADRYGYVNAFLTTKKIAVDLEQNTAKITLHLTTGERYRFGVTTFNAPFFSKKFLAKFLPYAAGDFYSSKQIEHLQESLSNSNFFQKVDIKPQLDFGPELQVPVAVNLTPRKARQYTLGAGFSTDSGARGSLGMEHRYLTQNGHSFKGSLQASQVQSNLELHYIIPGIHPATDYFDLSLNGEALYLDKGKSLTEQFGIGYVTVIKGWQPTVKLNFQHERYQLGDGPYADSFLLIPSINILRKKSDDPIRPNKGYSVNIYLQGANKYLLASDSFLQIKADAKYMYTFPTKTQLILRTTLGFTAVNEINDLPLSLQFYTGGTQSIRGFAYESIGPGRNLAVGSVELRQKIIGDFYLATFFDVGNASNDLMKKPNQGLGIGIVWRTILGSFELTFAKALNVPGSPGRIQFSMGPEL